MMLDLLKAHLEQYFKIPVLIGAESVDSLPVIVIDFPITTYSDDLMGVLYKTYVVRIIFFENAAAESNHLILADMEANIILALTPERALNGFIIDLNESVAEQNMSDTKDILSVSFEFLIKEG